MTTSLGRGLDVVIPTHNRPSGLASLLSDLHAAQAAGVEIESVTVVNSNDGVNMRSVIDAWRRGGLRITYLITGNNIAMKRNAGASWGSAPYVLFLDDDVRIFPESVRGHLDLLREGRGQISCGTIRFPADGTRYISYKSKRHSLAEKSRVLPAHRIITMNMCLRRADFQAIGRFCEEFERYGHEDLEFGFRAVRLGFTIMLNTAAPVIHHEVEQNWRTYGRKLYISSYYGAPILLNRAPEAMRVRTFAIAERMPYDSRTALASLVISILAYKPVVRLLHQVLLVSEQRKCPAIGPIPEVFALAIARMARQDREGGRAARVEELFQSR